MEEIQAKLILTILYTARYGVSTTSLCTSSKLYQTVTVGHAGEQSPVAQSSSSSSASGGNLEKTASMRTGRRSATPRSSLNQCRLSCSSRRVRRMYPGQRVVGSMSRTSQLPSVRLRPVRVSVRRAAAHSTEEAKGQTLTTTIVHIACLSLTPITIR